MSVLNAEGHTHAGQLEVHISLNCAAGEVVALLGPNGAGKSTTLRTLAGLNALTAGEISIDGQILDNAASTFIPTQERGIGMVFQDYVLFPHLTVRANIAFSPRARDVDAWIERMNLTDVADRKPSMISGGQAQRCALARALATDPRALLLDEPLAALDASTRMAVRSELRDHLTSGSFASVLVTHDPLDALVLADHLIVLEHGKITQSGATKDVAATPRTEYVASLMGVTLLRGTAAHGVFNASDGGRLVSAATQISGEAIALVRPESISLHRTQPEGSPRNVFEVVVTEMTANLDRVRITVAGPPTLVATVTASAVAELELRVGSRVWLSLKATDVEMHAA